MDVLVSSVSRWDNQRRENLGDLSKVIEWLRGKAKIWTLFHPTRRSTEPSKQMVKLRNKAKLTYQKMGMFYSWEFLWKLRCIFVVILPSNPDFMSLFGNSNKSLTNKHTSFRPFWSLPMNTPQAETNVDTVEPSWHIRALTPKDWHSGWPQPGFLRSHSGLSPRLVKQKCFWRPIMYQIFHHYQKIKGT